MSANNLAGLAGPEWLRELKFDDKGLVTAVAVDDADGTLLMLAHMNAEALRLTLETGRMTYWSRSRQALWVKGETSGNTQSLVSARLDCDGDALLFRVVQEGDGKACHEGTRSCFSRVFENGDWVRKPLSPSPPAHLPQ